MSLKFQLSKKSSSLNMNRLTLIRFLDVKEVRDWLFTRGVCVCVCVCVCEVGVGGRGGGSRVLVLCTELKMRGCMKFCNHF